MKSHVTNTSTTSARRFVRFAVGLVTLAVVSVGLAQVLYLGIPASPPAVVVAPAMPAAPDRWWADQQEMAAAPAGELAHLPADARRRGQEGGLLGELFSVTK